MNEKRTNIEIIASSLEEAIEEGLEKLGLPEDAVEIEILDEGNKGLFGLGSRQSRIRLTVKNDDFVQEIGDELKNSVYLEKEEKEDTRKEVDDEDHDLNVVKETVVDLLRLMKVPAEVKAERGEPDDERSRPPILIDILGDDLSILIGRKAETLDALQFITRLIVGKELEKSVPISIDVQGYRKRRTQQIRKLANRVADQVRETGRSQSLEPMPPNERRIVHIELKDNPHVYTESTGEGNRRKVVIYPQD